MDISEAIGHVKTVDPDGEMVRTARAAGIDVAGGARGFVFGAGLEALVKFLDIGTRLDVRD